MHYASKEPDKICKLIFGFFNRHLLFGSKGIDLQQISQKLETLSSKRTFEPLQPIADSDIESFLKNERENAILSLIDEVNKNVSTFSYVEHTNHIF